MYRTSLGSVISDRIAQFGIFVIGEQKSTVRPAPLAGTRVRVQGAADDQPVTGDGVDAQQVAVGQGPPGLAGLDRVVVAGAYDQVAGAGTGAVRDADRRATSDDAEADQFVTDAAGQFAAQRVVGGHQQRVGAACGEGDVGVRGGVDHLLRVPAEDAAVLVVVGQDGGVAVTQPQAGVLFPPITEPDRCGEPGVAEGAREQGHAAAVLHRLQLAGVPGKDHLPVAGLGVADGRPGPGRAWRRPRR